MFGEARVQVGPRSGQRTGTLATPSRSSEGRARFLVPARPFKSDKPIRSFSRVKFLRAPMGSHRACTAVAETYRHFSVEVARDWCGA